MRSGSQSRSTPYQGWWVVLGAFIAHMFAGLAHLIRGYGWRMALPIVGTLAGGIIVLMVLLLIRSRPSEEHLRGAGELDPIRTTEEDIAEQRIWTYRELITNRNFLLLAS